MVAPSRKALGLIRPWQHPALEHWDGTSHGSTQPQSIGTAQAMAATSLGAPEGHKPW